MVYNSVSWESKLLSFGVPAQLATRMSSSLAQTPYSPEQFSDMNQLVQVMQQNNFQSLDWWTDFYTWLQEFIKTLTQITPGIILTIVGGAMAYFLRNVKIKNIPIGVVGLIPMSYGLWIMVQPFLPKQG